MFRRALALILASLCAMSAQAQDAPTPMLLALRTQNWAVAEALAAANPDPLAAKLVRFIRLLKPGQASAQELAAFLAQAPDWPDRPTLFRRLNEAVAAEPDASLVTKLCATQPLSTAPALQRCAEIFAIAGKTTLAEADARAAWVQMGADSSEDADFLARWQSALRPMDQWARFENLLASGAQAARKQLGRLDDSHQRLGSARLAFRGANPRAMSFLAAVPEALRADPGLLLDEARFLRRTNANAAAVALWQSAAETAEAATPGDRRAPFRTERDALARQLLAAGDAAQAYRLANDAAAGADDPDLRFLAGWIALRRHDAGLAASQFTTLAAQSKSAITQARAAYWLGRIYALQNLPDQARLRYGAAAQFPTTYYGQAASRALGEPAKTLAARIAALRDPPFTPEQEKHFAGTELARATLLLAGWNDQPRGADFLVRIATLTPDASIFALDADLARRLAIPDAAVRIARLAGHEGIVLAQTGWPRPVHPPADSVDPALVLGLMRQESSFDAKIISPSGARGLMQVMQGTAAMVAQNQGGGSSTDLSDPDVNMRAGTAYLATLLEKFGGVVPYALAAYNAGPRHVPEWISANGDAAAASDPAEMIDWIEQIPFAETRNYVQRVMENTVVYSATP